MSKPFFSGFLDYTPNYDLHVNGFDQELFHRSLEVLNNALYERGVIQLYHLTAKAFCQSIAQTLEDYIVSLRTTVGQTLLGAFTLILQEPGKDSYYAEILLVRDTSLHESSNYADFLLEFWDNLVYADTTLYVSALDQVSVVDRIALSSLVEKIREMSKSCHPSKNAVSSRKQYRVYDYTQKHPSTPYYRAAEDDTLPFNARERFLKLVDALKKVHRRI